MKAKQQKQNNLAEIKTAIEKGGLSEARKQFQPYGQIVEISGEVLKVIRRNGESKLFIKGESMNAFINFNGFPEKFRKKQKVTFKGELTSFGFQSICINVY